MSNLASNEFAAFRSFEIEMIAFLLALTLEGKLMPSKAVPSEMLERSSAVVLTSDGSILNDVFEIRALVQKS